MRELALSIRALGAKLKGEIGRHLPAVFLIVIFGFYFLFPVAKNRPFDPDNLIALTLAKSPASDIFTGGLTSYLPAYRPVSKLALYIQYQLSGLGHLEGYFLVNLAIWILVAIIFYFIVVKLSRSRSAATIAALALLLDPRALSSLVWIGERQSTLCILFGLIGMAIAVYAKKIDFKTILWLNFFLLLSILAKEYGLAFLIPVAIIVYLKTKKLRYPLLVFLSVIIYFFLRYLLGGGANQSAVFCEDMGYFKSASLVCYNQLSLPAKLGQYLYNAAASFVSVFLPFLFNSIGSLMDFEFKIKPIAFAIYFLLIDFSVALAFWKKKIPALICLVLIIGGSAANFMLFRDRNHLVSLIGLYCLAALGLAEFLRVYGKHKIAKVVFVTLSVLTIFALQGMKFKHGLAVYVNESYKINPCRSLESYPNDVDKTVVKEVSTYYGLNLNCDK